MIIFFKKIFLLRSIFDKFPDIQFKIYCKADNLLKFNQFILLKKAGLVQVFIDAESLNQGDLDALNKILKIEIIKKYINMLK